MTVGNDQQLKMTIAESPFERMAARIVALLEHPPVVLDVLLSIVDQMIVSGTSFATAVIVGRACSRDQLGVYYLMLSIVLFLHGVQESLVSRPYTIFCTRQRGRRLIEYTGSIWIHNLILIVVSMVLPLIVLIVLSLHRGAASIQEYWVLLATAPSLMVREAIRRLAFARLRLTAAIAIDATVSALQLAGLVLLWYLERLSVASIFSVMGGACGLACIAWFIVDRRSSRFVPSRYWKDWLKNWSFAKWTLLSYMTVDTIPSIMPWIVTFAAGPTAAGLLGACYTLIGLPNIVVTGAGNFVRPKASHAFASGGAPALLHVLITSIALFVAVFGAFCAVVFVLGDRLATLVYGPSFTGLGLVILALAGNILAGCVGTVLANGLWVLDMPRQNFRCDICMAVITIVAALCLVFPYGVLGAAIASVLGTSAAMLLRMVALYYAMSSVHPAVASIFDSDRSIG